MVLPVAALVAPAESTKAVEAKEKIICGVPHIQVRCKGCSELMWTSQSSPQEYCETCLQIHRWSRTIRPNFVGIVLRQYHGASVRDDL